MTYGSKLILSGLIGTVVLMLTLMFIYSAYEEHPKIKTGVAYVFAVTFIVFILCLIAFPLSLIWRW